MVLRVILESVDWIEGVSSQFFVAPCNGWLCRILANRPVWENVTTTCSVFTTNGKALIEPETCAARAAWHQNVHASRHTGRRFINDTMTRNSCHGTRQNELHGLTFRNVWARN